MKKKTVIVSIRIREDIDNLLEEISSEFNFSKATLVKYMIETTLFRNEFDDKLSKKLNDKVALVMLRSDRTEITNHLYIIKNMYQRIIDLAMSYYFTTGCINMKAINKVLDMFEREFKHYPEKEKLLIQSDFEMSVKSLRNEDNILEHFNRMKLLSDKRKRK